MDIQEIKTVDVVDTPTPKMPAWAPKFLEAYAECGEVKTACAAARISRNAHYLRMKDTPDYRAAVEQVDEDIGGLLQDLAVSRVRDGVRRLVLFQGEPVMVDGEPLYEVEYNTQLHQLLLKRFLPDQYRERSAVEVSGSLDLVTALAQARSRMVAIDADTDTRKAG